MTEEKLLEKLREEYGDAKGGRIKLARLCGLSPAFITDVFAGRRRIGPTLAKGIGYEQVVSYRKRAATPAA